MKESGESEEEANISPPRQFTPREEEEGDTLREGLGPSRNVGIDGGGHCSLCDVGRDRGGPVFLATGDLYRGDTVPPQSGTRCLGGLCPPKADGEGGDVSRRISRWDAFLFPPRHKERRGGETNSPLLSVHKNGQKTGAASLT